MTESPIKLASVPGSLELNRALYRECVELVKGKEPTNVVSFNEPDKAPAFIHYIENNDKPFAVAIYFQQQKARYFVLLRQIPHALRVMIVKLEKEHAKQNKPARILPPAAKRKPDKNKRVHPWRSANRGLTIQPRDTSAPFRSNRRSKA